MQFHPCFTRLPLGISGLGLLPKTLEDRLKSLLPTRDEDKAMDKPCPGPGPVVECLPTSPVKSTLPLRKSSALNNKISLLAARYCPSFWSSAKLVTRTSSSWIYATQTGPGRVLKVSRDVDRLYREFKIHRRVEATMRAAQRELVQNRFDLDLPFVPACLGFCPDISALFGSSAPSAADGFPPHACGYFMEHICPLGQHHAKYLIRRYLSRSAQSRALSCPSQQPPQFLVRVFLGDTIPLSDRWNADLRDRPAFLEHLLAERVEVSYLAASMGATLAILHWACGVDASGVEFVLGRDIRGHVQFWLLDFSDCRPFQRTPAAATGQLVDAVVHNEPFWPRWINMCGLRELWGRFRIAYLDVSDFILGGAVTGDDATATNTTSTAEGQPLPRLFMNELEKIRGCGTLFS